MRSRRLIKKISKELSPFFQDAWLFKYHDELVYHDEFIHDLSAKGIMHVGGGTDYWGEGQEAYTVLEMAERVFWGWQSFCGCEICQDQFDPACDDVCEVSAKRLKLRPTYHNIVSALMDE
ncbi:hypothetical protein QRL11_004473 [Vibrio parahaemolyticus]|nr:hypothetical protein [Vibrio parahaemolyticus]